MTYCTDEETVKAAKKPHVCSWCGESIVVGESYKRWRCYGDSGVATLKAHTECFSAACELANIEGESIEVRTGDNPRGCNCGFYRDCERCKRS